VPARRFGVKVTQWMVGFGPTAWSRHRGEIEYGVKWIPFGGYIRMVGMLPPGRDTPAGKVRRWSTGPFQSLIADARAAAWEDVRPGDQGRLFYQRPWWQRVIIMAGGPVMNIVLGFVFFAVAFSGIGVSTAQPVVQAVQDCVIPVSAGRTTCVAGDPATPAAAAGLRPGDRIVAFGGEPVRSWDALTAMIRGAGDRPVQLEIVRDGAARSLALTPAAVERRSAADPGVIERVGYLGVEPAYARERMSLGGVVTVTGTMCRQVAESVLHLPERMAGIWQAAFSDAPRATDSPVGVLGATRLGGDVASAEAPVADRMLIFLQLLGSFNIAMGVFNLIPLLPLDGGHIAAAFLEGLKRGVGRLAGRRDHRPVDVAKTLPLTTAAALVLIAMAVLLAYADLVNPVRFGS
jgi:membrane-associated protease RseP (regulator of RpoE activity)